MTVAELIARLQTYDKYYVVSIEYGRNGAAIVIEEADESFIDSIGYADGLQTERSYDD